MYRETKIQYNLDNFRLQKWKELFKLYAIFGNINFGLLDNINF